MDKPVMSPAFWRELAESKPTGEIVTPKEVESWFDGIWPVMLDYIEESKAKKPSAKRFIKKWWHKVRPEEIAAARQRLAVLSTGGRPAPINETPTQIAQRIARQIDDVQAAVEESRKEPLN